MAAILIEAPAVEPITLAEAKAYLRLEHGDDDNLVSALIIGAASLWMIRTPAVASCASA